MRKKNQIVAIIPRAKIMFLFLVVSFCFFKGFSQTDIKVKNIDNLVEVVNKSTLTVKEESGTTKISSIDGKTENVTWKTLYYLNTNKELIKVFHSSINTKYKVENLYYYNKKNLILAMETMSAGRRAQKYSAYFENGKLLYSDIDDTYKKAATSAQLMEGNNFLKKAQKLK